MDTQNRDLNGLRIYTKQIFNGCREMGNQISINMKEVQDMDAVMKKALLALQETMDQWRKESSVAIEATRADTRTDLKRVESELSDHKKAAMDAYTMAATLGGEEGVVAMQIKELERITILNDATLTLQQKAYEELGRKVGEVSTRLDTAENYVGSMEQKIKANIEEAKRSNAPHPPFGAAAGSPNTSAPRANMGSQSTEAFGGCPGYEGTAGQSHWWPGKRMYDEKTASDEKRKYTEKEQHQWVTWTRNYLISRCPCAEQFLKWCESKMNEVIGMDQISNLQQELMLDVPAEWLASEIWSFLNLNLQGNALTSFENVEIRDQLPDDGERGFDAIIETCGLRDGFGGLIERLRPGGTLVVKSREPIAVGLPILAAIRRQIVLRAVKYGPFPDALSFVARHARELDLYLDDSWQLENFEEAFELARRSEERKICFQIGD